ncbi:thymidylate synthase [bacterium]|jgi:thymidylate synthase|nr:thymidylate synthase [bacterium]
MKEYLDLLEEILENGETKEDRTGTGTISIFGHQLKIDLRKGFPLLTTKKVFFKSLVYELLWFLKGKTNIHEGLSEHTSIWNPWADKDGNLGPIYGYQWRHWDKYTKTDDGYSKTHVDQIENAIHLIKTQPDSRRIIVSAWNVADIEKMALPPCHTFFQFYVVNGHLDCQLYQRSADVAVGVPFNIASYALLQHLIANECNLIPRFFVHTFGDAHIYSNHIAGVNEQLKRSPTELPKLVINKKPLSEITYEDIQLENYTCQPFIKFAIAV